MAEQDWLAGQFEQNRQHLQAVAYSMLGMVSDLRAATRALGIALSRPRSVFRLHGRPG